MMNARHSNDIPACRNRQYGLTLVELMVAMVISLIIMAGVASLYVSTKRNYMVEDAFSRLQENERYATSYMSMIIRNAGYVGCSAGRLALDDNMTNTLNTSNGMLYNFSTGIEGYEYTGTAPGNTYPAAQPTAFPAVDTNVADWTAAGPSGTPINLPTELINTNLMLPGSDVLITRAAANKNVEVVQNNSSAQLFVQNTGQTGTCSDGSTSFSGLCDGDILIVSDCQKSVTFQATNVQGTGGCPQNPDCVVIAHSAGSSPGNSQVSWGAAHPPPNMSFGPGSEVMGIVTRVFFVGMGANGLPSLYVKEGTAAPEELVEGVENMQVLYGLDTDNNDIADEYVTADNVKDAAGNADFGHVVSVRVSLLLMSAKNLNNHTLDTKTYPLAGVWDTGAGGLKTAVDIYPVRDKRLRKVATFTIKLRNRSVSL